MKKLLFFFFLIPLASSSQSKGSLAGNVFMIFNSSKTVPDAGAHVWLYNLAYSYIDSDGMVLRDSIREATCDVMGNYKVNNLVPGRYFVIIGSKVAMTDPVYIYNGLRYYPSQIKSFTGYDIEEMQRPLLDEIDSAIAESHRMIVQNKYKKYDKQNAIVANKIDNLIKNIPDKVKLLLDVFAAASPSHDFDIVTINAGEETNKVVKFEVSYHGR